MSIKRLLVFIQSQAVGKTGTLQKFRSESSILSDCAKFFIRIASSNSGKQSAFNRWDSGQY